MPHSVLRSGHVSMGDYALRRIGVETSFRRLSLCLGIREEKIRVLPTHSYIEHAAFAYEPASAVYSKPPRYRYSPSYIRRPSNTLCHRIITQEQCPVDACFLFKESELQPRDTHPIRPFLRHLQAITVAQHRHVSGNCATRESIELYSIAQAQAASLAAKSRYSDLSACKDTFTGAEE